MDRTRFAIVFSAALLAAGCATAPAKGPPAPDDGMADAITQPIRDLNLIREAQAAALTSAVARPYAPPPGCAEASLERASLDEVLGPDIDAPAKDADKGGQFVADLAAGAVRGVTGLPFRGIVRKMTGAEKRDREQKKAVVAGMLRRAYLKGFGQGAGCPVPEPPR